MKFALTLGKILENKIGVSRKLVLGLKMCKKKYA
jgi:hypothetical protein